MKITKSHTLIRRNVKYGRTSFTLQKLVELQKKSLNTIIIFDPHIPLGHPVLIKLIVTILAHYLKQLTLFKSIGDHTK